MFLLTVGIIIFIAGIETLRSLRVVGETGFLIGIIFISFGWAGTISGAAHLLPKHHLGLWLGLGLPIFAGIMYTCKFFLRIRRISLYHPEEGEDENLSSWFDNIGKQ